MGRCRGKSEDGAPIIQFDEAFISQRTSVQESDGGIGSENHFRPVHNTSGSENAFIKTPRWCSPKVQVACCDKVTGAGQRPKFPECFSNGDRVSALEHHSRGRPM